MVSLRNLDDGLLLELMLHVYDEDIDRNLKKKNKKIITIFKYSEYNNIN